MSEASLKFRRETALKDAERDKGLKTPEDVIRYDNIAYDTKDPVWNLLDVYRPKNRQGKLPVIFDFHGGGWVYGTKDTYQYYCMALAEKGFAVINFSYRLAPEYQYPSAMLDAVKVLHWMEENAEQYGLDLDHVYGVGDSAGAHQLALLTAKMTDPSASVGFEVSSSIRFQAVVLNCGIYDLQGRSEASNPYLSDYLGGITEEKMRMISPVSWIHADFPPVFLMTCTEDFLYWETEPLVKALKENAVPFEFHVYAAKKQRLGHVFYLNLKHPLSDTVNEEECAFLKKH